MAVQTFSIASSANDKQAVGTFIWSDGSFFANTLLVGNNGGTGNCHAWLRFTGVTVPQGTTLTSAILNLNNDGQGNGSVGTGGKIKVHCEAVDNSTMPADASAADSRTLTTGTALTPAYTTGIYSLNITNEVQAVIDRAGWSSGNALSVFVKDNASSINQEIRFRDYSAGSSLAAQLEITTASGGKPWYYFANQAAALAS